MVKTVVVRFGVCLLGATKSATCRFADCSMSGSGGIDAERIGSHDCEETGAGPAMLNAREPPLSPTDFVQGLSRQRRRHASTDSGDALHRISPAVLLAHARSWAFVIMLHPSYFMPCMQQYLESKLYSDVEGTCSGQFGSITPDIGKGMVVPGNGRAEFITRYRAIVFKPFMGEVVDGVSHNVTRVRSSPSPTCFL